MNEALTVYDNTVPMERRESSFAAVLAMIVGLLAVVLTGGSVSGDIADMLPTISAVAAPGVLAWVMTYLACTQEIEQEDEEELCYA